MGLRKKKSLLDQAGDYLDQAVDQYHDQVKPQLESAMALAVEKAGPVISDAKTKAAPVIADARAKASPVIADARAKAGPAIAAGAALAAEKVAAGASLAAEKAADAAEAAADKVSEVTTPKKKGSKLKKLLVLTGIAAVAVAVAKKLQGGKQGDSWQSSYTPTPAPAPAAPASPAAPMSGATDDDEGGASPDEAISDQAEAPHAVTTPDDPAEVIDVEKK